MGKQTTSSSTKSKKAAADNGGGGVFGKGNVTATQVAFIVDRYLSDNNFLVTRSAFRSEASSLLPIKSTANQSAKSLLKLGDMLDGYIHLKAQKILLDQEKTRLEHEKSRVQNLLRGMQHVMNAYNGAPPPSMPVVVVNPTPPAPACFPVPVHNATPVIMSRAAPPSNSISQHSTPPTTTTAQLSLKRRNTSKHAATAPKRSRTNLLKSSSSSSSAATTTSQPVLHHPPTNHNITPLPSTSPPPLHASSSSVVKCLFNSGPQTPSPSPTDKSVDNQTPPSSNKKILLSPPTQQQYTTSTNRTVITSETIHVSPMKQVSYYSIERNHCISSPIKRFTTNRDHVKGRLDFDASSEIPHSNSAPDDENSGGSPSQDDEFDFDLPNLDCLGGDFNFSDLLGDFDLDGFCPTDNNVGSSPECLSGSPDKMVDGSIGDHELLSGMSSTFTEIQSEQDMNNISGPNSVTSVKSVTKCIKVFSPVKSRRSIGSSDREIVDADVVV